MGVYSYLATGGTVDDCSDDNKEGDVCQSGALKEGSVDCNSNVDKNGNVDNHRDSDKRHDTGASSDGKYEGRVDEYREDNGEGEKHGEQER